MDVTYALPGVGTTVTVPGSGGDTVIELTGGSKIGQDGTLVVGPDEALAYN